MKNLCGTPFSKYTGKKLSNHLLKSGFWLQNGCYYKNEDKIILKTTDDLGNVRILDLPPKKLQKLQAK